MNSFEDKRVLFFVPETNVFENGIYSSQVLGLAEYISKNGAECLILHSEAATQNHAERDICGVGYLACRYARQHHYFFQVQRDLKRVVKEFSEEILSFRPTHIYTRTAVTCCAIKSVATKINAQLIYSVRGADVAERMMQVSLKNLILAAYIALMVRRALRRADIVNVVSKAMQAWVLWKYGKASVVLPCCVADSAFVDISSGDRQCRTIVYSGGMAKWQCVDETLQLFKRLSKINDCLRFKLMSREIDALTARCTAAGVDTARCDVGSFAQKDVPAQLSKATVAVVLREDTIVNRVASPLKVGECLAAGLPLILSSCVGDAASSFAECKFVRLVTKQTKVSEINTFVMGVTVEDRVLAQKWAWQNLTFSGNVQQIQKMFA